MRMKTFFKTVSAAATLAVASLSLVQSAEARPYWDRRGDDTAIAIGAGLVGLAVGAVLADRGDGRYYDNRYYQSRRYVRVAGYPDYYYYYDGAPGRYYRDRYFGQSGYYGYGWNRGYGGDRWGRGYDRWDRRDWDRRGWYGRDWNRRDWDRRDRAWDRGDWRRDRRNWERRDWDRRGGRW